MTSAMAVPALAALAACSVLLCAGAGRYHDAPELLDRDDTSCECNVFPGDTVVVDDHGDDILSRDWDINCTINGALYYRAQINPEFYFNLNCQRDKYTLTVNDIPRVDLKTKSTLGLYFNVEQCTLPPRSYGEVVAAAGVTAAPRLLVRDIKHGASVQRQHLGGLRELGVSSLDLTRSGVTTLPDDLFQDSEHLTELVLSDNRLVLEGKEFRSLKNLQVLEMSGCELTELPAGLLALPALRTLVLEDNSKLELRGATFSGLPALEDLRLVRNSLRTLPPDVFHNLPSLTTIDMSRNTFTNLPDVLFKYNRHLSTVHLNDSKVLAALPDGFLANMESLTEVDLSKNYLSDLPGGVFRNSTRINKLFLQHNDLSTLQESVFHTLRGLTILNMSFNKIKTLPNDIFRDLSILEELHLDHNRIESLESGVFQGLRNLRELNLQSNMLSTPDDWYLNYPSTLLRLDLSRNYITRILREWQDGGNMGELVALDLSHNKISKIVSFNENLRFMKYKDITVDLSNNDIYEINLPDYEEEMSRQAHRSGAHIIIEDNPVTCDCNLLPFVQYRVKTDNSYKVQIQTGSTKCSKPAELAGELLSSIRPEVLTCDYYRNKNCSLLGAPYNMSRIINCSSGLSENKTIHIHKLIDDMAPQSGFSYNHTELILDYNNIEHIETSGNLVQNITVLQLRGNNIKLRDGDIPANIEVLDLRDNGLVNINGSVANSILTGSQARTVLLSGNKIACNCDNKHFLFLLHNKRNTVADYQEIECAPGSGWRWAREVQLGLLCTDQPSVAMFTTVCVLTASFVVLSIVYFRHETTIKVWLVTHVPWMRKHLLKRFPIEGRHFVKDVFLSYSQKDQADVYKIMKFLEHKKYTTTNHLTDWPAGACILDSIQESIKNSCTTLFFITPSFVESAWSTHEFREAFRRQISEYRTNIVVVVKGDVDEIAKKNKYLKAYLKKFTYLKFDDPLFRKRLMLSLPVRLPPAQRGAAGDSCLV